LRFSDIFLTNRCARFGNLRVAGGGPRVHSRLMSCRLSALLRAHRLRLKAEWNQRLRVKPPSTALANPDILIHRMDETLGQLGMFLRNPVAVTLPDPGQPGLEQQLRQHCRCGLNPLMDYFVTGSDTLHAVLPELAPDESTLLDQGWYFVAGPEIESLCAVCRRAGSPALALAHPLESQLRERP